MNKKNISDVFGTGDLEHLLFFNKGLLEHVHLFLEVDLFGSGCEMDPFFTYASELSLGERCLLLNIDRIHIY